MWKWTVAEKRARQWESRADVIVIQNSGVRNGRDHTGWADCLYPPKEERSSGLSEYLWIKVTYYPHTIILLFESFQSLIDWISFAEITFFLLSSCMDDNSFISFSGYKWKCLAKEWYYNIYDMGKAERFISQYVRTACSVGWGRQQSRMLVLGNITLKSNTKLHHSFKIQFIPLNTSFLHMENNTELYFLTVSWMRLSLY